MTPFDQLIYQSLKMKKHAVPFFHQVSTPIQRRETGMTDSLPFCGLCDPMGFGRDFTLKKVKV